MSPRANRSALISDAEMQGFRPVRFRTTGFQLVVLHPLDAVTSDDCWKVYNTLYAGTP